MTGVQTCALPISGSCQSRSGDLRARGTLPLSRCSGLRTYPFFATSLSLVDLLRATYTVMSIFLCSAAAKVSGNVTSIWNGSAHSKWEESVQRQSSEHDMNLKMFSIVDCSSGAISRSNSRVVLSPSFVCLMLMLNTSFKELDFKRWAKPTFIDLNLCLF